MPFYDCREEEKEISPDSLLFLRARSFVYVHREREHGETEARNAHRTCIAQSLQPEPRWFSRRVPSSFARCAYSSPDSSQRRPLSLSHWNQRIGRSRTRSYVRFMRAHASLGKDKWIIGLSIFYRALTLKSSLVHQANTCRKRVSPLRDNCSLILVIIIRSASSLAAIRNWKKRNIVKSI